MRRVTSRQRLHSFDDFNATADSGCSSDDEEGSISDYASCHTHASIPTISLLPSSSSSRSQATTGIARNSSIGSFATTGFESACPSFDEVTSMSKIGPEDGKGDRFILEPPMLVNDNEETFSVKKRDSKAVIKKTVSFSNLVVQCQPEPATATTTILMNDLDDSLPITLQDKPHNILNINQDTQIEIISFLTVEGAQSLSLTCHYFQKFLVEGNNQSSKCISVGVIDDYNGQHLHVARNTIWWNLMCSKWPYLSVLSNNKEEFDTSATKNTTVTNHNKWTKQEIMFTDYSSTSPNRKIQYGKLLRHTSTAGPPTKIDSCFYPISTQGTNRTASADTDTVTTMPTTVGLMTHIPQRRISIETFKKFLSYKMKITSTQTLDHYQIQQQGHVQEQEVQVVQFTGQIGRGDRSIRSDKPFPRPLEFIPIFHTEALPPNLKYNQGTEEEGVEEDTNNTATAAMGNRRINRIRKRKERRSMVERFSNNRDMTNGKNSVPFSRPKHHFFQMLRKTASEMPKVHMWTRNSTPFVSPYISSLTFRDTGAKPSDVDGGIIGKDRKVEVDVSARMIAYFEVSILERDETQEPEQEERGGGVPTTNGRVRPSASACVAIGISTNDYNVHGRMPGWDAHSYGYHGDDGGLFHARGDMIRVYGPKYGMGDTVGCGVNYENGGIFYTLNGDFLGYAWYNERIVKDGNADLFPTVGVDSDCPLACNFGHDRPFVFDFAKFTKSKGSLPL